MQHCHYMIALVRTSGELQDRQSGLSQFIVELSRLARDGASDS